MVASLFLTTLPLNKTKGTSNHTIYMYNCLKNPTHLFCHDMTSSQYCHRSQNKPVPIVCWSVSLIKHQQIQSCVKIHVWSMSSLVRPHLQHSSGCLLWLMFISNPDFLAAHSFGLSGLLDVYSCRKNRECSLPYVSSKSFGPAVHAVE